MPELKMYELYDYCDNVKFEFNLYRKNANDLEWLPYRMKVIVDEATYSIDGFYLHKKMIEVWIAKMQELFKEREKYTFFDENAGKSISTVTDSRKEMVLMEYQNMECCWGEELEFEIQMQNTEDYRDEIFVDFEIWLKAAAVTEIKQGYSIGFRFNVKYDDVKTFCDCLKKQYEELSGV